MTVPFTVDWVTASEVILSGDAALRDWREQHRQKVPGHEYTPQFKRGRWDGTWVPGPWCRESGLRIEFRVSRGLLPRLTNDFGGTWDHTLATEDDLAEFHEAFPRTAELRDYQLNALDAVLVNGWGRIAFATNAGKGAIIALLSAYAVRRELPVLILCDEVAVFDALQGEVAEWGELEPALVKRGVTDPPTDSLCTLAMVPTLARRLAEDSPNGKAWRKWASTMQMVLLDEADKATADTWRLVLSNTPHTLWRAGFSGTFGRTLYHDLVFEELMGPVLARVQNEEMVRRGVSARPELEVHPFDVTAALGGLPRGDEWWRSEPAARRRWTYEAGIVNNTARHVFVSSLVRPDTPTAIIVNRVDHGQALADAIPGAVFLDGSKTETERLTALEAFQRRELLVLVVTKILDRGTNRLGNAEDLIFASSEGSSTQVLQRMGRGLRRGGGKAKLRLVDIVDTVDTRGRDKRYANAGSYFANAARRRLYVYATEKFEVRVVRGGHNG